MSLPGGPERSRWKPARAGIRNVWEYDDQTFAFADGRLILRGPNGSGKSNALALLFPFLLDGTMSAAAMDPFAGGRSMRSLLLGVVKDDDARAGRFRHDQRLGYVWLELERTDADGTHHVTIGCGARATAQRDATSWFFVTPRRVGVDLDLAPGDEPLARGRLIEVLGAEAVSDSAEDHRAAVDRALFGFGPDRHRKLVGLIRVLRRPQLAGRLDPDLLSTVLSEGLAALSPAVLDDVAASLDDLEATQRELEELRTTRSVVDAFVPVYQRYLVNEAAERAGAALAAAERRGRARRDRRDAQDDVEASEAALAANTEARSEAEQAARAADAERMAVIESPAYRDAASLREVTAAAVTAEEAERGARRRRDEAQAAADEARQDAAAATTAAAEAGAAASRSLTAVLDAADRADAPWTLSTDEAEDPDRLEAGARVVERARRDDLREVRGALEAREVAARDHAQAERAASAALAAADAAAAEAREADDALAAARSRLRQATAAWAETAPGLGAAARDELVEAVGRVGGVGEPDLAVRYRVLVASEREALATAAARGEDRRRALAEQVAALEDERERIASEVDPGPEPPSWRRAERAGRPGAPLWACCDFAPDLGPDDAAGLEAALDAAGLLDAWVGPDDGEATLGQDGQVLDSWLSGGRPRAQGAPGAAPPAGAPTLAEVLVPLPPEGSALAPERVAEVLTGVGLGALGVAVDRDGRFALGPLRGRARQDAAQFIGATARAERRRRRLAEIDSDRAELDRLVADEEAEAARLVRARAALDEAEEQAPATVEVQEATAAATAAEARARSEAGVAERAAEAEAEAAAVLGGRGDRLRAVATERRLEPTTEALDEVGELLGLLSRSVARAVTDRRLALERQARADREHVRARGAAAVQAEREDEWRTASAEAAGRRSRADTLQEQVGAEARAAEARLARAEQALEASRVEGRRLEAARDELSEAHGRARRSVETAQEDLTSAEAALVIAGHHLDVLRRQDLLAVLVAAPAAAAPAADGGAGGAATPSGDGLTETAVPAAGRQPASAPEVPDAPEDFAAWVSAALGRGRPDEAELTRTRKDLDTAGKRLLDDIHHSYDASIARDDEVTVVEVTSEGGTFPLARLAQELAASQERLEQYLTEGDREVFERYLLNQVSHELRRLLGEAAEFVDGVNRALAGARTASGLTVELRWELGVDDAGVRDAVRLLRRDVTHLGADDLDVLRSFFERVIREQRAERPEAGYRAALDAALDYRAWHQFRPYLRTPTGGATRLTRARFKELSGGEQAVSLHLPLFAAAAAHYDRAEPTAPRLIALDEAFAGIDEAMRGELMGLTVRFDLDVIMTGHELWGAYAEVPAVAIHDLLRRPPEEGVSVLSLRWDGGALQPADGEDVGPGDHDA